MLNSMVEFKDTDTQQRIVGPINADFIEVRYDSEPIPVSTFMNTYYIQGRPTGYIRILISQNGNIGVLDAIIFSRNLDIIVTDPQLILKNCCLTSVDWGRYANDDPFCELHWQCTVPTTFPILQGPMWSSEPIRRNSPQQKLDWRVLGF